MTRSTNPSSIGYAPIDENQKNDDAEENAKSSKSPPRHHSLEVGSLEDRGTLNIDDGDDSDNDDNDDRVFLRMGEGGKIIIPIDDAIESLGYGPFQKKILIATGICVASDAMEIMLLSFLSLVLQAEWDLSGGKTATITSSVFVGQMVGTLCLGRLADRIGRRPVFCFAATMIFVFGMMTALARNYETLLVMRFLVGFGVGGTSVPFDILAEFLPTSSRGTNLLKVEYFWTAGTLFVPLLARFSLGDGTGGGSWQLFVLLCGIPCLLSIFLARIFVPESPRWLLAEGRSAEAMAVLRRAAKENGHNPNDLFPVEMQLEADDEEESVICDLLTPKWRRTSLSLWAVYFGYSFGYYGTILAVTRVFNVDDNSGEGGNDGYNFNYSAILKSSAGELVGTTMVVFLADRVGRVPLQMFCYAAGGLSVFAFCLFASFEKASSDTVLILLAFLARSFEMGSSCVTMVSTPELLPTELRTTGHSIASAIGRVGGFLCPFVVEKSTPLTTIGTTMLCIHIITVLSASQLPETKGMAMGSVLEEQGQRSSNFTNEESIIRNAEDEKFHQEIVTLRLD